MEVKLGYKQSDVGVIPKEWDACEIGKLNPFITSGSRGWAQFYSDRGSPFIRITNMSRESIYLDLSDLKLVKLPLEAKEGTRTHLQDKDVLVSITADIGIIGYIDDSLPKPAYINQHIALVRFTPTQTDSQFVSYFLAAENSQKLFRGTTDTGAKAGMSLGTVRKIRLALPPLPEQRAIAGALGDVDALLLGLTKLITKKRDLKQAAMQQLITGHQRLPGFTGQWEDTTLGEIGECVIGLTYKPENVVEHGLLVLRSSNVQSGQLAFEDNVYVNVPVQDKLVTREGDILICVRNGSRALIGKCAMIDERVVGLTFGAFMSIYRTKYSQFVFHAFQSNRIQRQIRENIGATINQITNKDMKAFRLRLPPEREQVAIATVLSDMDSDLAAVEQRRDKTRALKQSMMQELLNGRTRLV